MKKKKVIAVMTCIVNELGVCDIQQVVAVASSYAAAKRILEKQVFDTLAIYGRKMEVEVIRDDDDYQVIMHLLGEHEFTRWYYLDEVNYYEEG